MMTAFLMIRMKSNAGRVKAVDSVICVTELAKKTAYVLVLTMESVGLAKGKDETPGLIPVGYATAVAFAMIVMAL